MTSLVTIRAGTVGPPVYCFHPLGGSAAVYGPLAALLDTGIPVFGLQSAGLVSGQEPDRSVPDMASRYARELDPPPGSIFLGYSFGGIVAFETLRLLDADAATLMLIDTDPLYTPAQNSGPWHILTRQVLDIALPPGELAELSTTDALERVRAAAAAEGRLPSRFQLDRLARMLEVCRANERAAARHVPAPYRGPTHVFRSRGLTGGDVWAAFAPNLTVHPVPVDHRDILGPVGYPYLVDGLVSCRRGDGPVRRDAQRSQHAGGVHARAGPWASVTSFGPVAKRRS